MAVASMEELRVALGESSPGRLLGTLESIWVDFKSQAYLLGTDRGSWELCKDVAALANASGGCLVVGVLTEKDANDASERAHELRPVPTAMANRDQHRDKIVAGVFPPIEGLQVATYAATEGACYLVVYVPAQPSDLRPFLVRYLFDTEGRRINGFGWPVRVDDAVTWHGCEHFQNRLSLGGLLQAAMAQSRAPQKSEPTGERLQRYTRVLEAMDERDPVLVFQFVPRTTVDLTAQMYGSEGIASAARARQPLRPNGFNTTPRGSADVRSDLGVAWGSRWRTAIDSDGVFVAAAPVTEEALGRTNQQRKSGFIVSPVFLLEWTNDVFRAFYEIVLPRTGLPREQWVTSLVVTGMRRGEVVLPNRAPRYVHDDDQMGRPSSDDFRRELDLTGDPNRDTFESLRLFYALFGFGSEAIPYCRADAFSPADFLEDVKR